MQLAPSDDRPRWEGSRRRLVWQGGAIAYALSAEDPESLRGPQFHAAWADELCAWREPQTGAGHPAVRAEAGAAAATDGDHDAPADPGPEAVDDGAGHGGDAHGHGGQRGQSVAGVSGASDGAVRRHAAGGAGAGRAGRRGRGRPVPGRGSGPGAGDVRGRDSRAVRAGGGGGGSAHQRGRGRLRDRGGRAAGRSGRMCWPTGPCGG